MKLELLSDGSEDCPLIRLYDFSPAEAGRLFAAVSALASGAQYSVWVHKMAGVEAVADCRLLLRSGSRDSGLVRSAEPVQFECILAPVSWGNVAGLIEPFVKDADGGTCQWLVSSGDARWLLSTDGRW